MNTVSLHSNIPTNKVKIKRKKHLGRNVPAEISKVAAGMESLFVSHLFEKMRETVPKSRSDSFSKSYYTKMLDQERANIFSKKSEGLGLKKIIEKQLIKNMYPSNQLSQKRAKGLILQEKEKRGGKI